MKDETAYLLRIPKGLYYRFRLHCLKDAVSVRTRLLALIEKDTNKRERGGANVSK